MSIKYEYRHSVSLNINKLNNINSILYSNQEMSSDSYSVPTLSLSGSRSRKNIPTKDAINSRNYNL